MKDRFPRAAARVAMLALLVAGGASRAQEPILTPVDFEKLKLRTLDEPRNHSLPPDYRKALGLPASRIEFKQLAAGDAATQYFFMVRSDASDDDICVSIRDAAGTRMYLTSSSLQYRGGAYQRPKESIRMIPSGDQKAAAEFEELLRVWAQVAQSL